MVGDREGRERETIFTKGLRSTEGARAEVIEVWLKMKLELNIEEKVKSVRSIGGKKSKLGVQLERQMQ